MHGGMLLLAQMSSNLSPPTCCRGLYDHVEVPLPFQRRLAVLVPFTENSHVLDGGLVGVIRSLDFGRHFFSSDRCIYPGPSPEINQSLVIWISRFGIIIGPVHEGS